MPGEKQPIIGQVIGMVWVLLVLSTHKSPNNFAGSPYTACIMATITPI